MSRASISQCYALLGVDRNSTEKQISDAYKKMARQHHPDMVPQANRSSAELDFKRLSDAYTRVKQDKLGITEPTFIPNSKMVQTPRYPAAPRGSVLAACLFFSLPVGFLSYNISRQLHVHHESIGEVTGRKEGLMYPPSNPFLAEENHPKMRNSNIFKILSNAFSFR